jgi:hypothetical protein
MDSELAAICENGKPEAPQRFAPWGGKGIDKGAKPSSPLISQCERDSSRLCQAQLGNGASHQARTVQRSNAKRTGSTSSPSAQRRCVGQPLSNRGMDAEEAAPRNGFRVGGDLRKWQTISPQRFAPWGGRGIDKGAKPSSPLVSQCERDSSRLSQPQVAITQ